MDTHPAHRDLVLLLLIIPMDPVSTLLIPHILPAIIPPPAAFILSIPIQTMYHNYPEKQSSYHGVSDIRLLMLIHKNCMIVVLVFLSFNLYVVAKSCSKIILSKLRRKKIKYVFIIIKRYLLNIYKIFFSSHEL